MRSPRGLLGAIVLLLALPLAVLVQVLFGSGSGTTVHFALALGSGLVSSSVFDFGTPRWIAWIGGISAGGLAAIFLLQGASELIGNETLTRLAYDVLGGWPERLLPTLFIVWLLALLLTASQGKTRVLGAAAMAVVACLEAYGYYAQLFLGTNVLLERPILRALYLLPFVWLVFESRKRRPKRVS